MHVTAIVLAAGKGLRLRTRIPKPLVEISSQPLIIYCLNILSKHPLIKDIIVVANPGNLKDICNKIRQYRVRKIKDIVLGGKLRCASVMNGLKAIDGRTDLVLIHDGARPFIAKEMVSTVIKTAKRFGAAIVGVPVKATVKQVKSPCRPGRKERSKVKSVERTLNRDNLWEIQTPQVFKKDLILRAYKKFLSTPVTDDASLVEKSGKSVKVVMGSYFNLKVTTPEDLVLAKAIAKTQIK
ncbi:MAG: 2-C-methyl-D-erythritol 4-phosphate cytidylyltransferase [Candidatus Omnitrophota bacterium]